MLVGGIHLLVRLREAARHALVAGKRLIGHCLFRRLEVLLVKVDELVVCAALAQVAAVDEEIRIYRLIRVACCFVRSLVLGLVRSLVRSFVRRLILVFSYSIVNGVSSLVHYLFFGFLNLFLRFLFHCVFGFLQNAAKLRLGRCGKGKGQHHGGR